MPGRSEHQASRAERRQQSELPEGGVGGGGREGGREKLGLERWEEKGRRQTRGRRRCKAEESAWAKVWSGAGEAGLFEEGQKVGVVGAHHTTEGGWEERKVEMLAEALKAGVRSLGFILGAVSMYCFARIIVFLERSLLIQQDCQVD